ncbi:uncharacterized protein LOC111377895 [Olea europaea var. sylvestris]|uniref:uncharacterized protein LOC111377895 n=1 Tax=Olea europaea var. sylvestris TaxID=158386 RepID=UPI000C1D68A5|nr:uncharacterized protein LOC111377895 [Olea europaea var. sylvestris]
MEERERIPVVEGMLAQDIPEDVEGVPKEERVPEMEVVSEVGVEVVPVQGIPGDAEGVPEEDRVLELEVVPVHGITGDVEGAPEEERVPEVEVVPEKTPDSPVVVFVSEEVVPTAGEGVVPMAGEMEIPEAHEERVVGKRPRVPSQYVLSPFTAEAKRRRFVDGTHRNLFREVDHAKWKAFETEWRALQPGASRTIAEKTISNAYKWFHDITTSGAWLADDHIDLSMDLLRDRAERLYSCR